MSELLIFIGGMAMGGVVTMLLALLALGWNEHRDE